MAIHVPRRAFAFALYLTLCACGQSSGECGRLEIDVTNAISAAPTSWNDCAVDSDCTVAGALCIPSCGGPAVASDHLSDLTSFLATDPSVTAACEAYAKSGCEKKAPIPECLAELPKCVANVCQLN